MSTAILGIFHRIIITPYDANNQLVPNNAITLQSVEVGLDKTVSEVDFTNSESNGYAEWAPTMVVTEFDLSAVVDGVVSPDLIMTTQINGKLLSHVYFYLTKQQLGPNPPANNPFVYDGKVLFTKASFKTAVKDVMKFTAHAKVIGLLSKQGVDTSYITGYVQA